MSFSCVDRQKAIQKLSTNEFDVLVVGGGITGASTAREAARRGYQVALVERKDFAFGTSSRSSKLIHGGLRYLESFELSLVFESLAERHELLKKYPHLVRPLPFYWPLYQRDRIGSLELSVGLWLYDALSLFRTPGMHQKLSKRALKKVLPFLNEENLVGGFQYYDAAMWDDGLVIQVLKEAHARGVALGNYLEARKPIWDGRRLCGFHVFDEVKGKTFEVKARCIIFCLGPWGDSVAKTLDPNWNELLRPSKGVHLVFSHERFPISSAVVMSHPEDGRISFVLPRLEFGKGVVIVGTTDSPAKDNASGVPHIEKRDVDYLMTLIHDYFPDLKLSYHDILSAYVGVRPLVGSDYPSKSTVWSKIKNSLKRGAGQGGRSTGLDPGDSKSQELQRVSREHMIREGPGQSVWVAGGKYTTHQVMAEQIVDFAQSYGPRLLGSLTSSFGSRSLGNKHQVGSMNRQKSFFHKMKQFSQRKFLHQLPKGPHLWDRYSDQAIELIQAWDLELSQNHKLFQKKDPEGFPCLKGLFLYSLREEMVLHLEDFFLRRVPLFLACEDHGLGWADELSKIWQIELGATEADRQKELKGLKQEILNRSNWKDGLLKGDGQKTA